MCSSKSRIKYKMIMQNSDICVKYAELLLENNFIMPGIPRNSRTYWKKIITVDCHGLLFRLMPQQSNHPP